VGRMVNHPMKEGIVGIISTSYFIRASNLWLLQLIALLEQMKYCNDLLIFERVLFRRKLELLIADANFLGFWRSFPQLLHKHGFFPFYLGRLCHFSSSFIIYTPFPFRYGRFKLFSQLLSYFSLFNQLFLSVGFNSSHANLYLVQKVVPICLQ